MLAPLLLSLWVTANPNFAAPLRTAEPQWQVQMNGPKAQMLESITANALRAHVRFLASDLLEGRGTPSRGLDLAAEYIATQFDRIGLNPAGEDGFFQTTTYKDRAGAEQKVRNVIGILPGRDAKLKGTYLLVTAHYDHLGIRGTGEGDLIYNGANDDASGVAGMIETAAALARLKEKPKRTVVFIAFWGEERGLLGSNYYGKNPVFPLKDTLLQINLEQIGRTDDSEAARVNAVSVTGLDYSDVGQVLERAGKVLGTGVEKHPVNSDRFFLASDNLSLAMKGVPAHTVCTAFEFVDYHRPGDHWDKLDYANMAKVTKLVALSALSFADSDKVPQWNAANPKTERFRKAREAQLTESP